MIKVSNVNYDKKFINVNPLLMTDSKFYFLYILLIGKLHFDRPILDNLVSIAFNMDIPVSIDNVLNSVLYKKQTIDFKLLDGLGIE